MITVLVADDMTLVRRLLAHQLSREADIEVAAEARDGRQAVDLCLSLDPDVVLMDLSMPRMNGIEAMERIKALRPRTRVILLSGHEELVSLGRLSGATECLDKNCTPQELAAAIRHAAEMPAEERHGGSHGEAHQGMDLCSVVEHLALRAGLTAREKAVLMLLVTSDDTVGQIASTLSAGWNAIVTETAVKHTTERVMNKLAIEPRTRFALIKFVLEQCRGNSVDTVDATMVGGGR